jgi:FAD/FMN-containing dehydrogenase
MCQRVLNDAAFYRLLLRVDEDMAAAEQRQRCRVCGAVLHAGHFARKPRGVPAGVGEDYRRRFSFCCANRQCRKRRMPPSVRFLGPKVYAFAVVVLISAMRCGATPARMRYLHELVGVSRHTVMRWRRWWCEMLPETGFWHEAAGTLMPPVAVQELPASLLERFAGAPAERLLSLLRWLSPISTGSPAMHAA